MAVVQLGDKASAMAAYRNAAEMARGHNPPSAFAKPDQACGICGVMSLEAWFATLYFLPFTLTFLVKLTLAPVLIGAVSFLQRRLGPSLGGLLTGMPVAAGPVLLALALDFGPKFAAEAAVSALESLTAVSVFSAIYAHAALRFHWMATLMAAFSGYAAVMWLLLLFPVPLLGASLLTAATQWAALRSMPARRSLDQIGLRRTNPPWWDIPVRMLLAAGLVLGVALIAQHLGPRISGLLTPFPVATTVLAVFTHRHDGPQAAAGFLRGLVLGLASLAVFFAISSGLLVPLGMLAGFSVATLASIAVSASIFKFSPR